MSETRTTEAVEPSATTPLTLLPAGPSDRYFDYCLMPYRPRREWRDKLRSENLFWHSLQVGEVLASFREPVTAIQRALGNDLTVWGAKWDGTRLFWELYFYDPQKQSPAATLGALRKTVAPWLRIEPEIRETVPYQMVSFDLFAETAQSGTVPEVNLYLTGTRAHAGRSYVASARGTELANTYRFMEPKREIDDVLPLVESSVFVDYSDPRTLAKVLIPELFACKKVCIAKKRHADAIYFSGISVEQLLWFFRRFDYPKPLTAFLETHAARFEHLYFDVGIDYRQERGELSYLKTSYYGIL
jgi:hypothetical protein